MRLLVVSGGRDDPVNYDDEQFTEEGTCNSIHDTYILYYTYRFYGPAIRDIAQMCIDFKNL